MSLNTNSFLKEIEIINESVQPFKGDRLYMATGDLSNDSQSLLEYVTYEKRPSRAALTAQIGDVLFARMKGTNKVLLVTEKECGYIFSTGFVVLRPSKNLNENYLLYYLKSSLFQDEKDKLCTGATQKAINNQNIEKLKIPLPSLATQKRIAEILDAADALKRKDQELLKKYDQLAQAIFIDMFGDPVKNEKGWDNSQVINYCECIVPGRDKPKSFTGNIPWVTTDDLNHLSKTLISKKSIGLSKSEIELVRAKIIPANSVIMTCVGNLGIVTINSQEIVINQQLHAFQCGSKINPVFLMYNLSYQKDYMYKMSSSTTVPYMNKTVCNSIPVICPPIDLQDDFEDKINFIYQQLGFLSTTESGKLFNSLIQKAFKGELIKS
jgi:type I restriction enzyme S subunit